MQLFDYDEIKSRANCLDIARELGLDVSSDGRCAATWRGGDNQTSVHVTETAYYDHAEKKGGSAIDLVAAVKFNGDIYQGQQWLGQRLGLTPFCDSAKTVLKTHETSYDRLIKEGYKETAKYTYQDADMTPVFRVYRMTHPEHGKTFLQQAANGKWSMKDVTKVLYRLPRVLSSPVAIVVEGEKDVETLISAGFVATCNAGGAGKWDDSYSDCLIGKDVAIIPDNDEEGAKHAKLVAGSLAGKAKSIRIVSGLSKAKKGDVTNWFESEGGTAQKLLEIIADTPELSQEKLSEEHPVDVAKEANSRPLCNYRIPDLKKPQKKEARMLLQLIEEVNRRFLGFPRRVGEALFDHDRDTGVINFINTTSDLFAWMMSKSKSMVDWVRGNNFVTKDEMRSGICANAIRYESISSTPDWPKRSDAYYCYKPIPSASDDLRYLNGLVDFFRPSSEHFRALIKAFMCAPIYYEDGVARPMWVIDSECPGAGKSTLANALARLYGAPPVEVKTRDLSRDIQEVTKRLVSSAGRQARVLLIDNVTNTFASEELSAMVTMPYITGRPCYGRGEESRPNNLTYTITSNNAAIDDDIAIRSFFIKLKKPENYDSSWSQRLWVYIEEHRERIFADIIAMLESHAPFDTAPVTRFAAFEEKILQPCCGDIGTYSEVIKLLDICQSEANVDSENAQSILELIRANLVDLGISPEFSSVWIRSGVVERWVVDAVQALKGRNAVQYLRNLARGGHADRIDPTKKIYPSNGPQRRSGTLWLNKDGDREPEYQVVEVGKRIEVRLSDGESTVDLTRRKRDR